MSSLTTKHGFAVVVYALLSLSVEGWAVMPSNPTSDPNFLILSDGHDLKKIKVSGNMLRLSTGTGNNFAAAQQTAYAKLKAETQSDPNHKVQWMLMDLDAHRVIGQSASAARPMFGASVAKVYTASALVDQQHGGLTDSQRQLMADMIVVSSNTAWTNLQRQIGGGDADRGRAGIQAFTQRMGYHRTRGYQGTLGSVHGNELVASELTEFLYDTYHDRYPGAETVWKFMHTGRTGNSRAKKYLPSTLFVGGKTGTYDGPTIDPETGGGKNPDGSAYTVRVRNQIIAFHAGGKEYGLAILADTGSDESAALMAGGLYREVGP